MIRSKNNAFTLVEVMLALAFVGMLIVPLMQIQSQGLTGVVRRSIVSRLFMAAELFLDQSIREQVGDKREPRKKELPDLDGELLYEARAVGAKSSLKNIKGLVLHQVRVNAPVGNRRVRDVLSELRYEPPSPKKGSS